jgi:hypothetical protein
MLKSSVPLQCTEGLAVPSCTVLLDACVEPAGRGAALPKEEAEHDCRMRQLPIHEQQRWSLWNASQLPLDQPHLRDLVSWDQNHQPHQCLQRLCWIGWHLLARTVIASWRIW